MLVEVWVRFGRMNPVSLMAQELSEEAMINSFKVRFEVKDYWRFKIVELNDKVGTEKNPIILDCARFNYRISTLRCRK